LIFHLDAPLVVAEVGAEGPVHAALSTTQSETSEQKGFANLFFGAHGYYQSPRAHAATRDWPVTESEERETVDALTFFSVLHGRLDEAVPTSRSAPL
jgi:hypothetical protein